jgi:hypothetical protein
MELNLLAERIKILENRIKKYQPICRVWIGSVFGVAISQPEHAEVSEPVF